jgi:hypothetical protein
MKFSSLALALVGLASAGQRWEITPLTEDAMMFFDDQAFDTGNYNQTLFNVTELPEEPSIKVAHATRDDDCDSTGNPKVHPDWCIPTSDKSQCNAAYYFPRQLYQVCVYTSTPEEMLRREAPPTGEWSVADHRDDYTGPGPSQEHHRQLDLRQQL